MLVSVRYEKVTTCYRSHFSCSRHFQAQVWIIKTKQKHELLTRHLKLILFYISVLMSSYVKMSKMFGKSILLTETHAFVFCFFDIFPLHSFKCIVLKTIQTITALIFHFSFHRHRTTVNHHNHFSTKTTPELFDGFVMNPH